MYVIYSITSEHDVDFGGWREDLIVHFDIVGVTREKKIAKEIVEKLNEETEKNIEHRYEWTEVFNPL